MKTLVAGWFSFEHGSATAGDVLACELACEWLEQIGCDYDLALAPPFSGGVNWRLTDPKNYSQVIFVCGPFDRYPLEFEFLEHFAGCRVVGLNLTMPVPLSEWNPFDLLLERDSSAAARPDMVFLSRQKQVPVVGVCLVEPYVDSLDAVANAAIQRLIAARELAVVLIDTRLDNNITGLRSPAEVESIIARMDVVITTRLHGTVLAIKNGVPAIAIDPEAGGAKICRQANTIGWPVAFAADAVTDQALEQAFDYCLTPEAKVKAKECQERAFNLLEELRDQFFAAMADHTIPTNLDLNKVTAPAWKSRIHCTNKDSLNLETYPHSYKFEERKRVKEEKRLLKQIAQRTLPVPVRRRLKTLWQGATKLTSETR